MDVPLDARGPLAQPTRARLFVLLGELGRPAGTDELADALGLHPNGVRAHLDLLRQEGLVVRSRPRGTPGRPRDAWAPVADAAPARERPTAYADLSRWLARALEDGADAVEVTGRTIGREIAPRAVGGSAPALRDALAAMGFRPRVVPGAPGEQCYALDACPYRDAVPAGGGAVCALHRGITRGLLDVLEPESALGDFRPEDPQRGGCRIVVRASGATDRATGA